MQTPEQVLVAKYKQRGPGGFLKDYTLVFGHTSSYRNVLRTCTVLLLLGFDCLCMKPGVLA